MRQLFAIILTVSLLMIGGCAGVGAIDDDTDSIKKAGITKAHVEPVIGDADDEHMGTKYDVIMGKEYGSFTLTVGFNESGHPTELNINAEEVGAFEGQAIAAQAFETVQAHLKELGVALGPEALKTLRDVLYNKFVPPAPEPESAE